MLPRPPFLPPDRLLAPVRTPPIDLPSTRRCRRPPPNRRLSFIPFLVPLRPFVSGPIPTPYPAQLNQTLLERDQEISSLQHKLSLAEDELEKSETKVKELKTASDEGETHRTTGENLARKVQLLEEELDKAEKDLKETTEK
jgi:hypothetical protein